MATRVVTGKVRLAFPRLFTPQKVNDDGQPRFSVQILIPKSDKATMKAIREAEKEAIELGRQSKFKGKVSGLHSIIKDGDEDGSAEDYPEREGMYYMTISADEQFRPGVVDKNLQPIVDQSEVYSGVYARVSMTAFAYNTAGNKGVSFGLNNVQVIGGGESLAGGKRADEDFDIVEDDEGDDLL